MGMKHTVVWDCDRCSTTASVNPGVVPEGWLGVGLSAPQVDAEDGHLDYTVVTARQFELLCDDCVIDFKDAFMYGLKVDSLSDPRKTKVEAAPSEEETVADLERSGIVHIKPGSPDIVAINKSAVDMKLPTTITPDVPVVGGAPVESDG